MLKVLRVAVAALILQALLLGPVLAQDFDSLVSDAAAANQRWVEQIDLALQAGDLETLQARAATAVAIGEQVESALVAALPLAPDDAARSRVEAVLTHVAAALESGRAALGATEFDVARSGVDAMRGEAEEALAELAPFAETVRPVRPAATPQATPVVEAPREMPQAAPVAEVPRQLPQAGESDGNPLAGAVLAGALTLCGLLASVAGVALRRRFT